MSFDFLQLAGKAVLVMGVANKKSVAWHVAQVLTAAGARVVLTVRTPERREQVRKFAGELPILVCDLELPEQIERLRTELAATGEKFAGLVHSVAFAEYTGGIKPFHETGKREFLRAVDISCYSLIAVSNALLELLEPTAAIVTISISTTVMASENYGYMAPIKAALDSAVVFLAKSLSKSTQIRVNAVAPGLLKTSASAGIPGYLDAYLFAEQATLRKAAVQTAEVANAVAFLLSPRASGINAQRIVIDAGMAANYFDREIVERVVK